MAPNLGPDENAIAVVVQSRDYPDSCVLTALVRSRMTVTERAMGDDALAAIAQFEPHVIVLALDPAAPADREFISKVAGTADAIVLLAPRFEAESISESLMLGVDVWVADEDCPRLFEAQIAAIRRRLETRPLPEPTTGDVIVSGPLRLDLRSYRATANDETVPLTPLEFRILAYLMENEGSVATPGEVLAASQEFDYPDAQARDIMKVHIRRIRSKLAAVLPGEELIVNVRGIGYLYERPESRSHSSRDRFGRAASNG